MKLIAISLATSILIAGIAQAGDKSSYPAEIQKDLEEAQKECAAADDGKTEVKPGFVRKLDLTGNKRADYIVDFNKLKCSTFESVYCGTGGCLHNIYVTTKAGELRRVFTETVQRYQISKAPGAKTITFDLHGGFCGKAGPEDCVKKKRITEKPFEFRDR
jgi:hypothetical protein